MEDLKARAAEELEHLRSLKRLSMSQSSYLSALIAYLAGEDRPEVEETLRSLSWEHDCSANKCIVAIRNQYKRCPDCKAERPLGGGSKQMMERRVEGYRSKQYEIDEAHSSEPRTELTKKELEEILGYEISDWTWNFLRDYAKRNRPVVAPDYRDSRGKSLQEHLTTNYFTYLEEINLTRGILQENRHRTIEPYEWFGPDKEPQPAGPDCDCQGCQARFVNYPKSFESGIVVDGLYVPPIGLHAKRGGIRWGDHKHHNYTGEVSEENE